MNLVVVLTLVVALFPALALAQGWNFDARTIGMGGAGGDQNILATSLAEARGDRNLTIPIGLFQTLRNLDTLNPRSATFDPSRAIEYASNPLYFQFGRAKSGTGAAFVHDIRNATLSRDLNDYRGFVPKSFAAAGLIAPKWGHTFKLGRSGQGLHHGVYAGGGPHLALRTRVDSDPTMATMLDAEEPAYVRNGLFHIDTQSTAQLAAAITGGYRGRFELGSSSAFLSVNGNYLQGLRLEAIDFDLRLDTDAAGRLASGDGAPLAFDRTYSSRGRGMSLDVGAGAVMGPWEIGISANNLAHRMVWRGASQRQYSLASLFSGSAHFVTTPLQALGTLRTHVPTDYRGNLSFSGRLLTVRTEIAREWDKLAFRAGAEHAAGRLQLRAATALVDSAWFPTAGLSVAVSRRVWLDLAGFTTNANIERQRRFAVASSVRITRR